MAVKPEDVSDHPITLKNLVDCYCGGRPEVKLQRGRMEKTPVLLGYYAKCLACGFTSSVEEQLRKLPHVWEINVVQAKATRGREIG